MSNTNAGLLNEARLYILMRSVAGDVLSSMLSYFIHPRKLERVLKKRDIWLLLNKLKDRNVLCESQYDRLYPKTGHADATNFDITLNFVLLRTLCTRTDCVEQPKMPLAVPKNGWSGEPDVSDVRPEALLVRVKLSRNLLFHAGTNPLIEDEYEKRYTYLTNAVKDLAGYLGYKERICKKIADIEEQYQSACTPECNGRPYDDVQRWIQFDFKHFEDSLSAAVSSLNDVIKRQEDLVDVMEATAQRQKALVDQMETFQTQSQNVCQNQDRVLKTIENDPVLRTTFETYIEIKENVTADSGCAQICLGCLLCAKGTKDFLCDLYHKCNFLLRKIILTVFSRKDASVKDIQLQCLLLHVEYQSLDSFTEVMGHIRSGELANEITDELQNSAYDIQKECGYNKVIEYINPCHLKFTIFTMNKNPVDIDNYMEIIEEIKAKKSEGPTDCFRHELEEYKSAAECPICLSILRKPVTLPSCSHTFCLDCLERSVREKFGNLQCPVCRCKFNIPPGGLEDMEPGPVIVNVMKGIYSLAINQCTECDENSLAVCFDCAEYFCAECVGCISKHDVENPDHDILTLQEMKLQEGEVNAQLRHIRQLGSGSHTKLVETYCKEHPAMILKYWCVTCNLTICDHCAVSVHWYHEFVELVENMTHIKAILYEAVLRNRLGIMQLRRKLTQAIEVVTKLCECETQVEKQITQNIDCSLDSNVSEEKRREVQVYLKKREEELQAQYRSEAKHIEEYIFQCKTKLSQVTTVCDDAEDFLGETNSDLFMTEHNKLMNKLLDTEDLIKVIHDAPGYTLSMDWDLVRKDIEQLLE